MRSCLNETMDHGPRIGFLVIECGVVKWAGNECETADGLKRRIRKVYLDTKSQFK